MKTVHFVLNVGQQSRVNDYGYMITDLSLNQLRLAKNQFVPGYGVLISTKHIQEPFHLPSGERALFFDDMIGI